MGLHVWVKDDIANILRVANKANLPALAAVELRGAYGQGFVAALVTLALALGLPAPGQRWSSPRRRPRRGETGRTAPWHCP